MELWLSAEVQAEVGDALRRARKKVEEVIVPRVAAGYGPDIERWTHISILRPRIPEGWGEVTKYHCRDRVAEFRLIIDYNSFKVASDEEQAQMLVESILRSADLFPVLKVKAFDIHGFRRDIVAAAVAGGLMAQESPPGSFE